MKMIDKVKKLKTEAIALAKLIDDLQPTLTEIHDRLVPIAVEAKKLGKWGKAIDYGITDRGLDLMDQGLYYVYRLNDLVELESNLHEACEHLANLHGCIETEAEEL